jgi:hypothetical protein
MPPATVLEQETLTAVLVALAIVGLLPAACVEELLP